jgi:hypothetical protein
MQTCSQKACLVRKKKELRCSHQILRGSRTKQKAKFERIVHHIKELYAFGVQETWMGRDYVQDLKAGMKFIHHGPTKHTCRRGSGGVGIVLRIRPFIKIIRGF